MKEIMNIKNKKNQKNKHLKERQSAIIRQEFATMIKDIGTHKVTILKVN